MKLRLNKLMAGLVMAGGVVALVGCGGGDAPDLLPTDIEATVVATDANAVKLASNVAVALAGTPIALTSTAATNLGVPAGSTLTFTGTGTGAGAIAAATLNSGTKSLQTNVTAGSCKFTVTGPTNAADRIEKSAGVPYAIGDVITVNPCALTAPVSDLQDGQTVTRLVTITLGNGGTVTAEAEIKRENGEIIINDEPVATVTATGGISVN